jgi:hypothetical protein
MIMRIIAAIAIILGLVACGGSASPASGTGIFGSVMAGPTCPVEMQGSPCPPRVWTGEVRATDANGHTFRTQTDRDGIYMLRLEAGTYEVVPVADDGPSFAKPSTVVVTAGILRRVDLTVDTGIR